MKIARASRKFSGIKYKLWENFRENKKTTLILILVASLGIFTGLFTAIRYAQGASLIAFNDFSISRYLSGELGTWSLFFSRIFSSTVVILIISISSLSIFLMPLSFIVIGYRSYLIGLNCSLIIILNGLSGIISCLLIILPCQLAGLLALSIFSSYSCKKSCMKKRYGNCNFKLWNKLLIIFLLLILICAIETLLLYLFSSKIILVL